MTETTRKILTTRKVDHTHVEDIKKWRALVMVRGFRIDARAASASIPFPFEVATNAAGRVVGACFTSGIEFGWILS